MDVLDYEVGRVKAFGVGIGLGVLQKVQEVLGGLFGPTSLTDAEFLACRIPPLANL